MTDDFTKLGPYGDFIPFDPECARVKELEKVRHAPMNETEAEQHRSICEWCMLLAVLSSEIVL